MTRTRFPFIAITMAATLATQSAANANQPLDCVMQPKATIELGSPEEGIVDEVLVERGDVVKEGDVVAKLDMRLERLAVELARLRAQGDVDIRSGREQLDFRRREVARVGELREKDMASQKNYDEADIEARLAALSLERAQLEHAIARVEYDRAKTQLERRMIRSPVDGVVVEVTISPGEYAYEQAPVMTIAQIDPLNVEVYVPIERYGTVKTGVPGKVQPQAPVGGQYQAQVTVVDRVFDAASGTFGVRLELPNPDYELPAGVRCTVRFGETATAGGSPLDADLNLTIDE